ncbi:enoyl-CoA hydratase/isomerase family protein [Microvirga pudoricolor]|uniref:enoyl-CoA hydratase/isomerase family protein n=1 Tax=Microvirga pudoricolor TaxID=2778729 RepID=UPI00195147EB|nr:enoyl-CoA hydratase/isomerase family protein [Microvirga pudoricolor]MBM6595515.1 enoyl-CoA hydratase/isomerase family protein [Microvirga pudoricolor]
MAADDEVICEKRGAAGLITLNRPQALNALTLGMVRAMRKALDSWTADPSVTRVVVTGAGDKAFCAGGDIRRLHDLGKAGETEEALAFWREEYQLNALIHRYPKPYVALADGIVMGGGFGISVHAPYRVGGPRYLFAMPEVGIGFFPDVGGIYALPRLPGRTGTYLALTGDRIRLADAAYLGLVTHPVPSEAIEAIRLALVEGAPVGETLSVHAMDAGPAPLADHRDVIDACFSADSVQGVLDRLDQAATEGSGFAAKAAATMRTKSPTSMSIALEQMRRGGALDFDEAMRTDFRVVSRIARGHDFYEGVRAVIIDKDNAPSWKPATLGEVDPQAIAHHFSSLESDELKIA